MPMYDFAGIDCGHTFEHYARYDEQVPCLECGGPTEHVWLPCKRAAIGDECWVEVKHGLCLPDGTPQKFYSKSAMQKEAQKRGLTNYVVHHGTKDGDRSKLTSRWV